MMKYFKNADCHRFPPSPLKSAVSSAVKSPLVVGLKPLRGGFEVVLLGSLGRLELREPILRGFQDILPSQLLQDAGDSGTRGTPPRTMDSGTTVGSDSVDFQVGKEPSVFVSSQCNGSRSEAIN